ncbi:MarR family transcriptional regulator [Glutamicibacter sp.]|uniref:MarR family winged helix-turn-helix transcriptional regulator n=1 Tax=Glutamicibacter sp. TaxID=1931995 RepID=UPI0028BD6EF3|nr:MarR family transcriptional regulator [Glutamicibacter sp.]
MSRENAERLSLGTLLFIAHRAFEEQIVENLHLQGFDFTLSQGRLAARIAVKGSRLTDLAASAGITKQSAGYLVSQLEASGLVHRADNPDDARAQLITITEQGRRAQRAAREIEAAIEARWKEQVGEEALAVLREQLEVLRPLIDRHQPHGDRD